MRLITTTKKKNKTRYNNTSTEKETEKNRNVFKRLNAHIATKRKTTE